MGTPDVREPSVATDTQREPREEEEALVRERKLQEKPAGDVLEASIARNESTPDDASKPRKTYGRVPDGSIFVVPQTHDMVSTLLSPTQPKNLSDIVILGVLALHILLFLTLPDALRTPLLGMLFFIWRTSYNLGIGYLLHMQSKYGQLVRWAKKWGIFDETRRPIVFKLIKRELESKITAEVKNGDYVFEKAPIEFNTWLVFRRLVDLILMCDFMSYMLFAMSCMHQPEGEGLALMLGRWSGGIVLFVFNIWVKLDAHRVVKDYAWYWGDFFFLIDQQLTFDGVFEMAPHPMYSVGYAGYYGISLVAASYTVLFVSILAHAAQFAFLTLVENPHIDKTYNPPPPRRRLTNQNNPPNGTVADGSVASSDEDREEQERPLLQKPDMLNNTHFTTVLLVVYLAAMTLLTPSTPFIQTIFVFHAVVWRLWHSIGIGAILAGQSRNKLWYRHFLKIGDTKESAWRQWKSLYYVSLCMCQTSFVAAAWKLYRLPAIDESMALFRHTVGAMMILLQIWTAFSIHESLGEFGWFYGDFFFDLPRPHLTYSGIYRYLNNPERLIGCAGIWGIVLITSSPQIFLLGLFSHVCALFFLNMVERPHMQKLYGSQIRQEAGVVKTIKKAIPPPVANQVKYFQGNIDKVLADAGEFVEEFIGSARSLPRAFLGVAKDTQALLSQYPARLSITLLADDIADYDLKSYSLNVLNAGGDRSSLVIPYGEPIRVAWTAPLNHSAKDWIGLYRVADNTSRDVTRVASMGRWVAVSPGQYDQLVADVGIVSSNVSSKSPTQLEPFYSGELVFTADKIFWCNGSYELRYHHDGKHNVMALSQPFEIAAEKVELDEEDLKKTDTDVQAVVEQRLLPVVRRCFDCNPEIAPEEVVDEFGGRDEEKFAKRVVYAVKEMFGVDFTPEVVTADGSVRKLAWRICNARKVLAPFSMNKTGANSPTESPPASPMLLAQK